MAKKPGAARTTAVLAMLLLSIGGLSQTITVDMTPAHVANSFVPQSSLGAGVDRLPAGSVDKLLSEPVLKKVLSAGWQTVSYRQNTELHVEAWHWNPRGVWSDPAGRGYFTGDSTPSRSSETIRYSYGYSLPHRGFTRNDGTERGYSRLTDGNSASYWKSNPYLTSAFTGEADALHPQWVILDLGSKQDLNAIRIDWAEPYARRYLVQFWTAEDSPLKAAVKGIWETFPSGAVMGGAGGAAALTLGTAPVPPVTSVSG